MVGRRASRSIWFGEASFSNVSRLEKAPVRPSLLSRRLPLSRGRWTTLKWRGDVAMLRQLRLRRPRCLQRCAGCSRRGSSTPRCILLDPVSTWSAVSAEARYQPRCAGWPRGWPLGFPRLRSGAGLAVAGLGHSSLGSARILLHSCLRLIASRRGLKCYRTNQSAPLRQCHTFEIRCQVLGNLVVDLVVDRGTTIKWMPFGRIVS